MDYMLKYVNQIDYIKLIELTTKQLFMAIYMEFNIYIFGVWKQCIESILTAKSWLFTHNMYIVQYMLNNLSD